MEQIVPQLHKSMSWEHRGNRVYYFRAFRQDGRVVKRYFGRGREAVAAANEDASRRMDRAASRQAEHQRRLAYESIAEQAASIGHELDSMVTTALIAAGFHRPQRKPWRKKRGEKKEVLGR